MGTFRDLAKSMPIHKVEGSSTRVLGFYEGNRENVTAKFAGPLIRCFLAVYNSIIYRQFSDAFIRLHMTSSSILYPFFGILAQLKVTYDLKICVSCDQQHT